MSIKAVIDRFEGETAVLLTGDDGVPVTVARAALPVGCGEGTILQVEMEGETLLHAEIDAQETERTKARIAEKLARLRRGEHRRGDHRRGLPGKKRS